MSWGVLLHKILFPLFFQIWLYSILKIMVCLVRMAQESCILPLIMLEPPFQMVMVQMKMKQSQPLLHSLMQTLDILRNLNHSSKRVMRKSSWLTIVMLVKFPERMSLFHDSKLMFKRFLRWQILHRFSELNSTPLLVFSWLVWSEPWRQTLTKFSNLSLVQRMESQTLSILSKHHFLLMWQCLLQTSTERILQVWHLNLRWQKVETSTSEKKYKFYLIIKNPIYSVGFLYFQMNHQHVFLFQEQHFHMSL